jgi:hypothetical protein
MIGREYFTRQAMTLLRLARATRDPAISAELLSKAADLDEKAETAIEVPARSAPTEKRDG